MVKVPACCQLTQDPSGVTYTISYELETEIHNRFREKSTA